MNKEIKSNLFGVVIAILATVIGSRLYHLGYQHGTRDEETRQATELARRHLACWRIDNGEATLEYRYVTKIGATCVKFGDGGNEQGN